MSSKPSRKIISIMLVALLFAGLLPIGMINANAADDQISQISFVLNVGESCRLAGLNGINMKVTDSNTIDWSSSNVSVATVDTNGKVTALSAGLAVITARDSYGKKDFVYILVEGSIVPVKVTSVVIDALTKAEITVGETLKLTAKVYPDNATNKNITWDSNNKSILSIDENGVIKGISEGKARVTATVDGVRSAQVTIEVKPQPRNITVVKTFMLGDQLTTDYGSGRFARSRVGGWLQVSGSFRENGQIPEEYIDFRLEWYNPHTGDKIYTDYDIEDESFEADFDEVPKSVGAYSYYTGFTTHYYDITQVRLLIYDEDYDEDDDPEPVSVINLGSVYLINRVV